MEQGLVLGVTMTTSSLVRVFSFFFALFVYLMMIKWFTSQKSFSLTAYYIAGDISVTDSASLKFSTKQKHDETQVMIKSWCFLFTMFLVVSRLLLF